MSVYYRLLTLSELGHTVDLMTYPVGNDVALSRLNILRPPALSFIKTIKAGPSLTKLFLDMVLFPMATARVARNSKKYDCLFVHEEAVAAGLVLKKAFGIPLIYDMHSSLARQFEAFGYANVSPVKRLFEWLEKTAIARADCVLTICPDLDRHVREKGCTRTVLIPNTRLDPVPEPKTNAPAPETFLLTRAFAKKTNGETLLFYGGTFEAYQGIDLMLEAFKIVAVKNRQAKLLVVGGTGDQIRKARSRVYDLHRAGRIFFTGTLSPGSASSLMEQADVLLSPRTRGTNTPLKLYAYMASGIPMVATSIHSHTQEIGPDHAFLAEPSAEALADALLQCIEDTDMARQKAKNAKNLYEQKFSIDQYRQRLQQALLLMKTGG